MATSKAQRIGIWIIAVFMAVGTIGSFVVIVLANENSQTDQARINELTSAYQKEYTAYQSEVETRTEKYTNETEKLSDKYYSQFSKYQSEVASFDAAKVTELDTEDLKVGDGALINQEDSYVVYYIGWNPSGKVFDGSIDGSELKTPLVAEPGGLIQGWSQGVVGMKVGGIRVISIPSELAYGETGSGDDIPANTPIKFVVMVIAKEDTITSPAMSEELIEYYQSGAAQ